MPEEILSSEDTFLFVTDVPPSFCDMGNAISSLIGQGGVERGGLDEDGEENVLLSEEHSLVLTCCWVSLKVKLIDRLQELQNISLCFISYYFINYGQKEANLKVLCLLYCVIVCIVSLLSKH